MVIGKEYYTQRDGREVIKVLLKPTKTFPKSVSYFYIDKHMEGVVDRYDWKLVDKDLKMVVADIDGCRVYLHRVVKECMPNMYFPPSTKFYMVNNCYRDLISSNIVPWHGRIIEKTVGYKKTEDGFELNKEYRADPEVNEVYATEYEAIQHIIDTEAKCSTNRGYLFFNDLGEDMDLVDLLRQGYITEGRARLEHLKRTAYKNPWYMVRYCLYAIMQYNDLKKPDWGTNSEGFICDPTTGETLCPYEIS